MNKIPINDLVPKELRKGKEYDAALAKMEKNLALPDKVNRYATHETGHLLYLIKTGLVSKTSDAVFDGPTIYIDDDGDVRQFSAAVSSNRIRLSDNTIVYTEELLNKVALASAAASVFEKELLGEDEDTPKAGGGDKTTLFKHCHKARSRNGIEFQGFSLWPFAQRETAKWLRENRTEVEGLIGVAKQIVFSRCFGLKVELSRADFDAVQNHSEIVSVLLQLLLELRAP